uniref:Uncharacterized protein n=1 Tax=Solanum tuberosum TaxID=4113 RepID=M1D3J9_SOLTU
MDEKMKLVCSIANKMDEEERKLELLFFACLEDAEKMKYIHKNNRPDFLVYLDMKHKEIKKVKIQQ